MPRNASSDRNLSENCPRRTATTTPSGIAISQVTSSADTDRISVLTMRCPISVTTLTRCATDSPRSPCTACPSQAR
jgi:hypothetical protein